MDLTLRFLLLVIITAPFSNCELKLFTENNAKFATSFYTALKQSASNKNFVVSPFSVQICGGMVYSGAGGQTAAEMVQGFKLENADKAAIVASFKAAVQEQEKEPLQIANRIYIAKGLEVRTDFRNIVKDNFFSEEKHLNFSDTENAAEAINNWVKNATHNKIKTLVDKDTLGADTLVLIANTIYFKGAWKNPFTEISKFQFWLSEEEAKEMDMMTQLESFKFGEIEELDAEIIELKYNNTDISMLVILPKDRNGLIELEKQLPSLDLISISQNLREQYVEVLLPKFTIEFTVDLEETLTKMGMGSMFSNAADFRNMIPVGGVKISKAIHKTVIEVNELGTEAAAVTGFGVRPMAAFPEFIADHPFIFVIKSKSAILFIGRLME